uniref:Signal recognition particle 19 kDa protein n=1 Tax=Parastrongyloides trichosuri TaxID=131310 RepID=A0A0N4ZNG1_PARTI
MDYSKRSYSDESKWICVYPIYLNSNKTVREGRILSKKQACENPTSKEIFEVLSDEGLNVKPEYNKMHPLDGERFIHQQGRVRVQLKKDDGSLFNPRFKSRKDIFIRAAEKIKNIEGRQIQTKIDPWQIVNASSNPAVNNKIKGKKK